MMAASYQTLHIGAYVLGSVTSSEGLDKLKTVVTVSHFECGSSERLLFMLLVCSSLVVLTSLALFCVFCMAVVTSSTLLDNHPHCACGILVMVSGGIFVMVGSL